MLLLLCLVSLAQELGDFADYLWVLEKLAQDVLILQFYVNCFTECFLQLLDLVSQRNVLSFKFFLLYIQNCVFGMQASHQFALLFLSQCQLDVFYFSLLLFTGFKGDLLF